MDKLFEGDFSLNKQNDFMLYFESILNIRQYEYI